MRGDQPLALPASPRSCLRRGALRARPSAPCRRSRPLRRHLHFLCGRKPCARRIVAARVAHFAQRRDRHVAPRELAPGGVERCRRDAQAAGELDCGEGTRVSAKAGSASGQGPRSMSPSTLRRPGALGGALVAATARSSRVGTACAARRRACRRSAPPGPAQHDGFGDGGATDLRSTSCNPQPPARRHAPRAHNAIHDPAPLRGANPSPRRSASPWTAIRAAGAAVVDQLGGEVLGLPATRSSTTKSIPCPARPARRYGTRAVGDRQIWVSHGAACRRRRRSRL